MKARLSRFIVMVGFLLLSLPAAANQTIYNGALAVPWVDWSWNATTNEANTSPVQSGTDSLSVTITSAWGALYLHANTAISLSSFNAISFWVYGGSGGNPLVLVANGAAPSYAFTAAAGIWTQVTVPFSAIGNPSTLTDLYWQDASGHAQSTFFLDGITLVSSTTPPPAAGTGPALSVDVAANRHAISADIYGMNYINDAALAKELSLPVQRWGGNSTSRYNWRNDTTNTGSDWYFENIAGTDTSDSALPDGSSADLYIEQNRSIGTRTLMTVPIMGWVANRRLNSHPYDCGFKVSKYGAQQSTDPWDTDCGNGVLKSGANITGNQPTDTSIAIDASFVANWVSYLVRKYGTAANGGVSYYDLDNEPSLWNSTHRDVHPAGTTYDEMRNQTYSFAAAVKSADPSAKTLGPVEWGWCGYLYSAADGCGPGTDASAHGNVPFVAWYLQQMKAYEQQHGVRILDYLDLHYYPAQDKVALSDDVGAATQALRLRSTRSLWDPAYIDESWISNTQTGGVTVQLIPRMKQWIASNYPGTRLAITEYNWGALGDINGALAQADVLGIFGREALDLATLWSPPTSGQPGAYAFRMYRNYDAVGHSFGDISVSAASTGQDQLSVYAAQRSSDNALTVMVLNKATTALSSTLTIANLAMPASASVYQYSAANLTAISHPANLTASGNTLSTAFPAQSITLFVLMPASGGTPITPPGNGNTCPTVGLWAIDSERNGQPGRGFTIEEQGGVLVLTVFGYDSSGNATFYQSAGAVNNSSFGGGLDYYTGGTTFGGSWKSASLAGSAGQVAINFTDSNTGTITFPGEAAKTISKFNWASATNSPGAPTSGLWAINSEENGQPGRGFTIEDQGNVVVLTVYGYDLSGKPTFYQSSGTVNNNSFAGSLAYYTGGTPFGGSWKSASLAGNAGQVTVNFTDSNSGTITFPGEIAKAISKFNWGTPCLSHMSQVADAHIVALLFGARRMSMRDER